MNIPRCISCNRGIYLSNENVCSGCGARLQLSINIHELELQIEVDRLAKKLVTATNVLQELLPPTTKWQRVISGLLQGAASFANGWYR